MKTIMVRTPGLNVELADDGPRDGHVALLLHGWPDDATTWEEVVPTLNQAGYRTIVPMLRGFGRTRISPGLPRTGDSGVLALDAIALLDVLGVRTINVVGHDWGSNIAEALAVGWPDRVERMALLSSPPRLGGAASPPFWHAQLRWYHWFMATKCGAAAVKADPRGFARIMWENWAPAGWFSEAAFQRVAASWDNSDFVDVTLHSYRARWDEAEPDPRSGWLEDRVKATRHLSVPTIYIQGEIDGVNPPPVSEHVGEKFRGPFERVVLPGVGHFPSREAPAKIASLLTAHFACRSVA